MAELIDRQELMKKIRCSKNGDCEHCDFFTDGDTWCDGKIFGTTIMQMPAVEPTAYGYNIDELMRFGRAMRALGVEERDIKNFLADANRVYTTLVEKMTEEMQITILKVMRGDING